MEVRASPMSDSSAAEARAAKDPLPAHLMDEERAGGSGARGIEIVVVRPSHSSEPRGNHFAGQVANIAKVRRVTFSWGRALQKC